jgi:hypothetical protein
MIIAATPNNNLSIVPRESADTVMHDPQTVITAAVERFA